MQLLFGLLFIFIFTQVSSPTSLELFPREQWKTRMLESSRLDPNTISASEKNQSEEQLLADEPVQPENAQKNVSQVVEQQLMMGNGWRDEESNHQNQLEQAEQPQPEMLLNKTMQNVYKCLINCNVYFVEDVPCSPEPNADSDCAELFCESVDFMHAYEVKRKDGTVTWQTHKNRFGRTRAGQLASMRDLCLKSNGLPVTRLCKELNGQAYWEQLSNVTCLSATQHRLTEQLNSLRNDILAGTFDLNSTRDRYEVVSKLRRVLNSSEEVLPVDIVTTEKMFAALAEQEVDATLSADMLGICSQVMASDATVLRLSAELQATNSLLHSFEDYMDALPQQLLPQQSCDGGNAIKPDTNAAEKDVHTIHYSYRGVHGLLTRNLSVFFVNPLCQNITGIAIYSEATSSQLLSAHGGFWYRFVYANESVELLKTEPGLEAATFLNYHFWQNLFEAGAHHLVFKVYEHDALFVETALQRNRRPRSKVLSISIPDFHMQLSEPLPFLLRNDNQRRPDALSSLQGSGCGYWDYNSWLNDGVFTENGNMLNDSIVVCYAQHLTQFSFLMGGSYVQQRLQDITLVESTFVHEQVLDFISIVGCCLSLFGLLGIWLTAALFKSWRDRASTKILLHLCLALTLQMIFLIFLNMDDLSEKLLREEKHAYCVALGAGLQYSVLVVFSWMLIIAFLQFQRYVQVIGVQRPNHYILIAALVAWTLPLLPTLLVVFLDPTAYFPSQYQLDNHIALCYPSGKSLTFGVLLPIVLITVSNACMVLYIFYSVFHVGKSNHKLTLQKLRLFVLLFFLLGLTWIFGILSYMHAGIAFSYLFCLTATLQGFVIFLYFVVQDEHAKKAWRSLCAPHWTPARSSKDYRQSKSMTTSQTDHF